MRGVVLAPILAAFLAEMLTGSSIAAGVAFIVVVALAIAVMSGRLHR